jgi:hypothetical protein
MNQPTKQQRPLAIAFALGALLTIFMGWMVLRMETKMLETGHTGFEGAGSMLVLTVAILATAVVGSVVWATTPLQSEEGRVDWSRLKSLNAMVFFFILFFVGFRLGPSVVRGEVTTGEVLFMLFLLSGLGAVAFSAPFSTPKSFQFEEE